MNLCGCRFPCSCVTPLGASALAEYIAAVMSRGLVSVSPSKAEHLLALYQDGIKAGKIIPYRESRAQKRLPELLRYFEQKGFTKTEAAAFLNALQEYADKYGWKVVDPILEEKVSEAERSAVTDTIERVTKTLGKGVGNVVGGVTAPISFPLTILGLAGGILGIGYLVYRFGGKKG